MRILWQEANSAKNKHSVLINAGSTVTIGSLLRHAVWHELKALGFSEASVNIDMSTEGNVPEDVNLWIHKSCTHNEEAEEEEAVSTHCQQVQ